MASAKQNTGATSTEMSAHSSETAGADKGGSNRRKFHRRDTHIVAQLNYNGRLIDGMVTNLSLEGCLFAPRLDIPVGDRVKLKLAGENKAVTATVKAVSELGVHCLLHAGGATLGRLSVEVDDMALLMLNASRPHVVEPAPAVPAAKKKASGKAAPAKKKAAKKKAVKKAARPAAKSAKKKSAKKTPVAARKKTPAKKKAVTKKKVTTRKTPAAKKKTAARKKTAAKTRRR